jgi:uncharacterized protein YejL (UPF0352 family)
MQTKDAIIRYCDAQIEAVTNERVAVIKEGRRDFILSIVTVLGLFLIIALLVSRVSNGRRVVNCPGGLDGNRRLGYIMEPGGHICLGQDTVATGNPPLGKVAGSDLSVRARLDSEV